MASRDEHGILTGDLDYGRSVSLVKVLSHIVPVYLFCSKCKSPMFHVVGEQPYGVGFGFLGFTISRKPIAKLGSGHHLICNACTCIAGRISKQAVANLDAESLP